MRRLLVCALGALLFGLTTISVAPPAHSLGPNAMRAGFDTTVFPGNDDGSTGLVDIGFPINFFGDTFSKLYVNNNGNVTFNGPLTTYTPFNLFTTSTKIIAPFFADVDTRNSPDTAYGAGTVDGRPAFGVSWRAVGCFNQINIPNHFQLLLIDRSDIAPGEFDIEFNYDQILWETGTATQSGGNSSCLGGNSARAGYSDGTAPNSFELPGSGVNGGFLDSNMTTGLVNNTLNANGQLGRYRFFVRGGTPTGGATDTDLKVEKSCNPATVVPGQNTTCTVTVTNLGPSAASSVSVTDDLATQTTLQGAPTSSTGFSCNTQVANPEITCTLATLAVNGVASFSYVVQLAKDAPPQTNFRNTAVVSSATTEKAPANNTATFDIASPTCTVDYRNKTGPQSIRGTTGNDVICGSPGVDNVEAGDGNDVVFGGAGNDNIQGGLGNDTLFGNEGDDSLTAPPGVDSAYGGPGTYDRCTARTNTDCEVSRTA